MIRIFVYGTLLRGEPNHHVLDGVFFLGDARTRPLYTLVTLGMFPGLLEGGTTAVAGEVYAVDPAPLAKLDRLEGHPIFYTRKPVALEGSVEGTLAYFLPEHYRARPAIAAGDWRQRPLPRRLA